MQLIMSIALSILALAINFLFYFPSLPLWLWWHLNVTHKSIEWSSCLDSHCWWLQVTRVSPLQHKRWNVPTEWSPMCPVCWLLHTAPHTDSENGRLCTNCSRMCACLSLDEPVTHTSFSCPFFASLFLCFSLLHCFCVVHFSLLHRFFDSLLSLSLRLLHKCPMCNVDVLWWSYFRIHCHCWHKRSGQKREWKRVCVWMHELTHLSSSARVFRLCVCVWVSVYSHPSYWSERRESCIRSLTLAICPSRQWCSCTQERRMKWNRGRTSFPNETFASDFIKVFSSLPFSSRLLPPLLFFSRAIYSRVFSCAFASLSVSPSLLYTHRESHCVLEWTDGRKEKTQEIHE